MLKKRFKRGDLQLNDFGEKQLGMGIIHKLRSFNSFNRQQKTESPLELPLDSR